MTTNLNVRSTIARAWIPTVGGIAAIAFAVAGCGGGSSSASHVAGYGAAAPTKASAPGAGSGASPTAGDAALVKLANSKLGEILVDSQGDTLYLWQADKNSTSTCNGACTGVWPPLITNGKPIAGVGVAASKLGTTKRSDGTIEVTYNGHPLYKFAGDSGPGQTTGEGNQGFGAEWDVLSAAGNKIEISS